MMDHQGQFNVSHLLGSAVDVAHYSTLHHPLQGYGGTIAAVGGPQGAGTVPPAATITLGYTVPHPPPPAAAPAYSVALAPQVSAHPHIQYYYEAAEPLAQHLQVRYNTSAALSLQPASPPPPQVQPPAASRDKADGANLAHQSKSNYSKKKRTPGTEGTSAKQSRKRCRNRGETYVSASGKFVAAKKYVDQDCQCRNECQTKLGTVADREAVFRRFWDIGDFGRQNAHLAQSVVMVPSGGGGGGGGGDKRRVDPSLDERHLRTVRRIYYVRLQEGQTRVRVCKSQFLRLHGVSNGRLDRVLQALHCEHPHALQDRRGQHAPSNKTAREDLEPVAQHILELQQQRPGSCGEAVTVTQEAAEKEMSVKAMHELYRRWCEGRGRTPVSLWVYRQVKARLVSQQGGENTKGGRMSRSLPAETLLTHQPGRNEDAAAGCQEAVLTPGDTTTTITDTYKHAFVSTTCSKPTTTTTTTNTTITNSTTTSTPAITSTTNTATISTSPSITAVTSTPTTTTTITPATTTTTTITITTATALEPPQQRRRRKQRQSGWVSPSMSRQERKTRRNKGEAYVTSTGKVQGGKVYHDEACECRHRCVPALGTLEARRQVFDSFWGLASFTRQNAHIARMVTLAPLSQRRTGGALARTYSRVYSVQLKEEMVRVCKLAFLRLHGVSNGRVDRVLQAVACQSPFALKDRRGCHSPINKTQEEDVSYALSHMCTFLVDDPGQPSGCYLPHDLNVEKMYHLYRQQCVVEARKPVGSFVYRKIMKERFNCHVKTPSTKTPKKDLEFARQHIKSCEVSVVRGGEGSLAEASVKGLHQEYVKRCAQEARKPVGLDVFRKLCRSRLPSKAKQ